HATIRPQSVAVRAALSSTGKLEVPMKLTPEQARAHAEEVRATSLTILKGVIPVETIDRWNAAFAPLLTAAILREGENPNRGAHMLSRDEGMAKVAAGEIPLVKAYRTRGDVMARDVRHNHRGTPNRTGAPGPRVVIGYSRRWLHRPEVNIRVPADVLVALPER